MEKAAVGKVRTCNIQLRRLTLFQLSYDRINQSDR